MRHDQELRYGVLVILQGMLKLPTFITSSGMCLRSLDGMNSRASNGTASSRCCQRIVQRPATRPTCILWILRTGALWHDLPDRCGTWKTVYSRFRRWQQAGIWERILNALQAEAIHDGTLVLIDSSAIHAHQQAAGARKKGKPTTSVSGGAVEDSAPSSISSPIAAASQSSHA